MRVGTVIKWNGQAVGEAVRVATVTKHGLKWDESAHPRKDDGKFREKGAAALASAAARKEEDSDEPEDPQYSAMFSVRDELIAPQWEKQTGYWRSNFEAGTRDDGSTKQFRIWCGVNELSVIDPSNSGTLGDIAKAVTAEDDSLRSSRLVDFSFYALDRQGHTSASPTAEGHAREVFRHVLGAVTDLMSDKAKNVSVIAFTGATEKHDKLYANMLRLMGKKNPNFVPIMIGESDEEPQFALMRKDAYAAFDKLLKTKAQRVSYNEVATTINAIRGIVVDQETDDPEVKRQLMDLRMFLGSMEKANTQEKLAYAAGKAAQKVRILPDADDLEDALRDIMRRANEAARIENFSGINVHRFSARSGWSLPIKYSAKWDESQHPREDDGRFAEKGKGGSGAKMATRPAKIDPKALSRDVLNRMHKTLKSQGYETRGADDVRQLLETRMLTDGELTHPDWIAAYDKATGGVGAAKDKKDLLAAKTPHVNWQRIKQLGFTSDPKKAGYLTPEGKMIDMSGAVDMSPRDRGYATSRALDHREAGGTAGMQELIGVGHIRYLPESGMFDMAGPPSQKQRSLISRLIAEHDGEVVIEAQKGIGRWDASNEFYQRGDDHFYHEYPAGTRASKVLADLDRYYIGTKFGTRPDMRQQVIESVIRDAVDEVAIHKTSTYRELKGNLRNLINYGLEWAGLKPLEDEEYTQYHDALPSFAVRGRKGDTSHLQATGKAYGSEFSTGKPVTFHYLRNTDSATKHWGLPKKGDRFGRDKEPSGEYMSATSGHLDGWEGHTQGTKSFANPLVIAFGGSYGEPTNWKHALSKAFGGLRGKSLSKALIAAGHDGVVTLDGHGIPNEILDLSTFDEAKARFATRERDSNTKHTRPGQPAKYFRERLIGGKADGIPNRAFDPQQLMLGTMIELEHTHNVRLAQEIARDHLRENPRYYILLSRFVEQPTMRPVGENPLRGWTQPGMFSMPGEPVKYSSEQPRSPAPHGVTIQGRFYPPGQWIPAGAMQAASGAQRRAIAENDSSHATAEEPDPDLTAHGTSAQALLERLQSQGMLRHATLAFGHGGVVAEVAGKRIVVRVAHPGELEQMWANDPAAAAASAQAGGIAHVGAIAGAYRNGTIILAEDFSDGEMNHELIHGLRDLGVIQQGDVDLWGGEEQMAYAYQRWVDTQQHIGHGADRTFNRIRDFFRALLGDKAAQQRRRLRAFDSGTFRKPVDWGKVAHRAVLLAAAAKVAKDAYPEVKARRQAVRDWLENAVYGGAGYHDPHEIIVRGDVDPYNPASGLDVHGTVMTGAVLFATREWRDWLNTFENDAVMKQVYSEHDRAELAKGMEATARIFGDFSQLDPEEAGQWVDYEDKKGNAKRRYEKGVSPIRTNSDPLFKETFDVTTVCPKQDLYVAVTKAVQHLTGSIFGKEARHIIKNVIEMMNLPTVCKYCYGQSSRDNAAQGLKSVAEVMWPAWQQMINDPKGQRVMGMAPTAKTKQAAMKAIFENEFGHWYWFNKKEKKFSTIYQAFDQYGADPEVHDLMSRPADVHDLFFDQYTGPKLTANQEAFMGLVREAVQGGLTPNVPKGWASYKDQLLGSTPRSKATQFAKIQEYNKSAGFRMNSQTDFRPWHVLETAQFLTHLKAQQGMAHVYTRVPEFVDIFGDTGIKFNLSCAYGHDMHGKVIKRADGRPQWDMHSFPQDKALAYRQQRPGVVGNMLVATSLDAVMTGLDDPDIDMMIPYHAGSVPKSVDKFEGWEDFSPFQHEHWPGGKHAKGDRVTVNVNVRGQTKQISLRWGHPITREHHNNDKDQYLGLCDALGVTPRFPQLCGRGHQWHGGPKAKALPMASINIDHPNYMKVVRDVAVTHTPQTVVDPTKINWHAAERHAKAWMDKGGKDGDRAIPTGLVQIVHGVVTGQDKEFLPQSPVGKDANPDGTPVLSIKKSLRHDPQFARRVAYGLAQALTRARHNGGGGVFE